MVLTSFILVSLMLSSCSFEYGVRKYLKDTRDYLGINKFWYFKCLKTWSFSQGGFEIVTCFPKEEVNCAALSLPYNVGEAKELYVNIQTETRNCDTMDGYSCTGKFSLIVHYQKNENNLKRVILPDNIPKKNPGLNRENFYYTNDTASFSVDQNYKILKLGFQGPFYCGMIKSVSLYYYLCPAETIGLAVFPEVAAPSKISSPQTSVGTCAKNAVKKGSSCHLTRKCYYNGTFEVFGSCECEAGFTNFYEKKRCKG